MPEQPPGCLLAILQLFGIDLSRTVDTIAFRRNPKFLSPAESSFYRTLTMAVSGQYVVFAKVRLFDIVVPVSGDNYKRMMNRVVSKHVDFVLCDPERLHVVAVIELDDKSHARADRADRDAFVDEALKSAGIPCLHQRCQEKYAVEELRRALSAALMPEVEPMSPTPQTALEAGPAPSVTIVEDVKDSPPPVCPKCGIPMVSRTAKRGEKQGESFWGCANYPRCRATSV